MPLVSARLAAAPSPGLTERVIRTLTALTVEVLGKELARTTVVVSYVSLDQWARAGESVRSTGTARFVVEAKVTRGTNSTAEKARYVREVNDALAVILGGEAAGYVIVDEIGAEAWGHAGETQEIRMRASPTRSPHVQGRPAQR